MELPTHVDVLQFETATNCNGNCTFCTHNHMTPRPPMPLHKIIDLTYHLAHKAKTISPFFMQEPLLEPRLLKILSNVKTFNPRAKVCIYTNMSVYPEKTLTKIMQWGLVDDWFISFYGATKKTHDKLQPTLDYYRTRQNIKKLVKLRNKLRWATPHIYLSFLVTPETLPQIEKTQKQWTHIVDHIALFPYDSWCGRKPYDVEFEESVWGSPKQRVPCQQLWNAMHIHCNGNLVPCCMDYDGEHVIGNVFDDWNLWWNSPKLHDLRMLHQEGKWDEVSMCRDCTKWRYRHKQSWVNKWMDKKQLLALSAVNA